MNQTDIIILDLFEYLRFDKQVKSEGEFARRINMLESTIIKIKNGTAHFTVEQIGSICREFNVNANFLFCIESKVFNTKDSIEIKTYLSTEAVVK